MTYQMNMTDEKEPTKNDVFEDGIHEVIVISIEPKVSKNTNEMFVTTLKEESTRKTIQCFLVATQGKRWMLKNLLDCVGIKKNEKGEYVWDISDVLNKQIAIVIENVEEEFINRNGESQKIKKSKIKSFKPTTIALDDDK